MVASRPTSLHLSCLRSSRSCLFRCRREMLPRRRLAFGRALAFSSPIFRVASSLSQLVVPFCCAFQVRSSSPLYLRICCDHAWVQVCCILLECPLKTGKRRILALKIRGHIETLCCVYDGNFHLLQLDYQNLVPLVASMPFLISRSRYSTRYSGYAWPRSKLMASWFLCGPFNDLLQLF